MTNLNVVNNDTFGIIEGEVNNSEINVMYFYAFKNNHDNTYTTFTEYYRGSTYSSFWVKRKTYNFVPETYTKDELLKRFKDCVFMDDTSLY